MHCITARSIHNGHIHTGFRTWSSVHRAISCVKEMFVVAVRAVWHFPLDCQRQCSIFHIFQWDTATPSDSFQTSSEIDNSLLPCWLIAERVNMWRSLPIQSFTHNAPKPITPCSDTRFYSSPPSKYYDQECVLDNNNSNNTSTSSNNKSSHFTTPRGREASWWEALWH